MRSSVPRWIRNFLIGSLVLNIMFFALEVLPTHWTTGWRK